MKDPKVYIHQMTLDASGTRNLYYTREEDNSQNPWTLARTSPNVIRLSCSASDDRLITIQMKLNSHYTQNGTGVHSKDLALRTSAAKDLAFI